MSVIQGQTEDGLAVALTATSSKELRVAAPASLDVQKEMLRELRAVRLGLEIMTGQTLLGESDNEYDG